MNYVVLDGKICSDILTDLDKKMRVCKFTIKNMYHNVNSGLNEATLIRCICYGNLAEYCENELWEGLNVLIVGRLLHRRYETKGGTFNFVYVGCNKVCKIEQDEYD